MKTLSHNSYVKALHKPMACFMILCLLSGQTPWAVGGGNVTNGPATIDPGSTAANTTVHVNSGSSVIQWDSLSNNAGENLNFLGGSGAVLNRVTQAVQFNGNLNASGVRIYIVSPNGVNIGSTAVINAADFVASGLNVENADFLDGGLDTFVPFEVDGMKVIGAVQNDGTINVTGNAALLGSQVLNNGTIVSEGGLIVLATGDEIVLGSERSDIVVNIDLPNTGPTYNVINGTDGVINNEGGDIVLAAGDDFAQALAMNNAGIVPQSGKYSVEQKGTINDTDTGNSVIVEMSAANQVISREGSSMKTDVVQIAALDVQLQENMAAGNELFINSDIGINTKGLDSGAAMTLEAETGAINADGTIHSDSTMTMEAAQGLILRGGNVDSVGAMNLTAGGVAILDQNVDSKSTLSLEASQAYAGGNITATDDLTIDAPINLYLDGDSQTIASAEGTTTITGAVNKTKTGELLISGGDADLAVDLQDTVNANDNIYIAGAGDVQLSGNVSALGDEGNGGVSVISTGGKIYTRGTGGLNVGIEGYSDYLNGVGVDLPYGEGEAAIVLKSQETLTLGTGASLYAEGWFISSDEGTPGEPGTDDRAGADLLATDATVIGGFERNEGDPMDIAIYAGSTEGDVVVDGLVVDAFVIDNYLSSGSSEGEASGNATVVLDARESVLFPDLEGLSEADVLSILNEYDGQIGGYRMEVVSRVTQWLSEAIDNGTLPFADSPEIMEALLNNDYVLRGAGAENNTRAWVLEDPEAVPGVVPLADLVLPELKGCPVEMDAAAAELAMNSDDLQLLIGSSLATNPNLQPCKACQKLVTAASILNDVDGARMAAMNQIFNTHAPIDAPFTPEVQASVATAFANLSDEDQQYALASEYVNAFVDYVAVLSEDLQAPVGDPVAYVLEKHGNAITTSENPNMAAYVMAQLQTSGESI